MEKAQTQYMNSAGKAPNMEITFGNSENESQRLSKKVC